MLRRPRSRKWQLRKYRAGTPLPRPALSSPKQVLTPSWTKCQLSLESIELAAPPVAPTCKPVMRGRLKSRLKYWAAIITSTLVLRWVADGLDLRWLNGDAPLPRLMPNHLSAFHHGDFVLQAISDLVVTQAAMRLHRRPLVVCPLGVVPKKGTQKYRLIWDGRYVNSHLQIPTFAYETLGHLPDWAQPGDYAFTIDLTSGFHHLEMHSDFWQYLGFEWAGEYYCFTSAPFGLAIVPWAFTLLTRSVMAHFRQDGDRCTGYIDDSMWFHQGRAQLLVLRSKVLTTFHTLGLVINMVKSQLEPAHINAYLGMEADLLKGLFRVPAEKRLALMHLLQAALATHESLPVRHLARIKGKLSAMSWAFGLASKLFTKSMDKDISKATTWNSSIALSQGTIAEMRFWLAKFDMFNGTKPMWPSPGVDIVIHVDAAGRSSTTAGGWGAWCEVDTVRHTAYGTWKSASDSAMSSTAQELQACLFALQSFNNITDGQGLRLLAGKSVQVVTDSMNSFYATTHGFVHAHDSVLVAQQIFLFCFEVAIRLSVVWVPREDNTDADAISKLVDADDCMLNPNIFDELSAAWGPFHVDLFASHTSTQLSKYYSKYYTPDTTGVDAFAFDWSSQTSWANPPFSLIKQVWSHAKACKARLCLVVPIWQNKPWWHLLLPEAGRFNPYVQAVQYWAVVADTLLVVDALGNLTPKGKARGHMMAMLVDFTTPLSEEDRLRFAMP